MENLKVIALSVFLERRKTRLYVGHLKKEGNDFVFTYDEKYLRAKNVIPLGPEFPLTKKQFRSDALFPSFEDRIPSRQNPAYPEYCLAMGIDPLEKNPFVLLSTIGAKGPSSFVFTPLFERSFTVKDLITFRQNLKLTTREFASVFEISQASLNALERGRSSGKDFYKRLEILVRFPSVALYFLTLNGGVLQHAKWHQAESAIKKLM